MSRKSVQKTASDAPLKTCPQAARTARLAKLDGCAAAIVYKGSGYLQHRHKGGKARVDSTGNGAKSDSDKLFRL